MHRTRISTAVLLTALALAGCGAGVQTEQVSSSTPAVVVTPPPTAVCPDTGVCAPHRPPPAKTAVCPDTGVCAPHRPKPKHHKHKTKKPKTSIGHAAHRPPPTDLGK